MCPQKWNASASPGLISEAAVGAPAAASTAPPTRARNPRRDVSDASRSESRSATDRLPAALGGGEHGLELRGGVERALGQHGALPVHDDPVRAARHVRGGPGLGVLLLVERA